MSCSVLCSQLPAIGRVCGLGRPFVDSAPGSQTAEAWRESCATIVVTLDAPVERGMGETPLCYLCGAEGGER